MIVRTRHGLLSHRTIPHRTLLFIVALLAIETGLHASPPDSAGGLSPSEQTARLAEAAYQFALGKRLAEEASFEEARFAFERAIELDEDDPYVRVELARFHAELAANATSREVRFERLTQAAEAVSAARALARDNVDILRAYAQIHLSLAELQGAALDQALEAFEALREQTEGDLQGLVSLAQIHLWKRNFGAAADVLREAASYRPDNGMVQRMLLDALLGSDALAEAEPLLAEIVARNPNGLEYRYRLSDVYLRLDRPLDAVTTLEGAPAEVRASREFGTRMVAALHQAGEDVRALAELDALAANHSLDEDANRLRVSVLVNLVRYDDALGAIDEWRPGDQALALERSLLRSRLLERVGRSGEAAALLRKQATEAPSRDRLRIESALAGVLERDGRRDEAIALLDASLEREPDRPVAVVRGLAELHHRAGRTDRAIDLLDDMLTTLRERGAQEAVSRLMPRKLELLVDAEQWEAVEIAAAPMLDDPRPENQIAGRIAIAEAWAHQGRIDRAVAVLDPPSMDPAPSRRLLGARIALLHRFDRPEAAAALIEETAATGTLDDRFFASQLWQRVERYDAMIPLLDKVLEEQPDAPQALFALASAAERTGDIPRAASLFERLLEQVPGHAPTLNYLGYMWAERGENLARARRMIERAVALDPDNGAYVDSLGWVAFKQGRLEEAARFLEWSVRLIDSDPTVHVHLGDVYRDLGRHEAAAERYRHALTLEPDDEKEVRKKLESLP